MGTGFSPAEEALYYQTEEAVRKRLRATRNPAELLSVVRQAFASFERAYASAPATARAAVACRAGCGTCCHNEVAVQAHEVLIAAEFIQKKFPPVEFETVIASSAEHRAAYFAGRQDRAWKRPKTACVLLRDGSCSIYESRPEICRAYHSNNLEGCKTNLAAGHELVNVKIEGLRGRMFAVMLAIDSAVEEQGFDDRAYDFGSALHEALTDSLCAVRWMRREAAFSDPCCERADVDAAS